MRVAAGYMPVDVRAGIEVGRAAEEAGIDLLGICDSPILYDEMYVTMTAALLSTDRIAVAPYVTNPVARHWTIHASACRALDRLGPGRVWMGMASGNGAVRPIGLAPASLAHLAAAVDALRSNGPAGMPILIAAAGPRTAEVAGRHGDGILVGTGLDVAAAGRLVRIARRARLAAGDRSHLQAWVHIPLNLVSRDRWRADRRQVEDEVLTAAIGYSRQALAARHPDSNVPEHLSEDLYAFYDQYDFGSHGAADAGSSNIRVLEAQPRHDEIRSFVSGRFSLTGDAPHCAARLAPFFEELGFDGAFFAIVVPDPPAVIAELGHGLLPLLRQLSSADSAGRVGGPA